MQRLHFLPSTAITLFVLAGCAGLPAEAKSPEDYRMPTRLPAASSLTETAQAEIVSSTPPRDCPITVLQDPPFVPPAPYSDLGVEGYFWYGSDDLWVAVPQEGVWSGLPHNPGGYTQKIPWWSEGYDWNDEPQPDLAVTGERLDTEAPSPEASGANGAYADDMGSAMMMGVDFPTLGCWRITGKYRDAELSYVVWVAP